MVFREGVKPANRQTFANNVVRFIVDQGLEGVDFDWEYPGMLLRATESDTTSSPGAMRD